MIELQYPEKPKEKELIATTGFFDGVHCGHKAILRNVVDEAKRRGRKSCLVTFWPHPRIVLGKGAETLRMLTNIDEKAALVAQCGIDYFYIIPFTQTFSMLDSETFFCDYLKNYIGIAELYVGYNHHFGHGAGAGFDEIKLLGEKYNIPIKKVEAVTIGGQKISSTNIRNALIAGDVETANAMLGYEYQISGKVIHGNQIGRRMGFPTANIQSCVYKQIPQNGVYAAYATVHGKKYEGMLNIGLRPTFKNTEKPVIEVNIFDFDEEIYDANISVNIVRRIRSEVQFNSSDELKNQLLRDKNAILQMLN